MNDNKVCRTGLKPDPLFRLMLVALALPLAWVALFLDGDPPAAPETAEAKAYDAALYERDRARNAHENAGMLIEQVFRRRDSGRRRGAAVWHHKPRGVPRRGRHARPGGETMNAAAALRHFIDRTGLSPDPIDFRNMLDEEIEIVVAAGLVGRPRNTEDKARERAVEDLIAWCIEGPRLEFGKTMESLAAFIASHRRPAIWAALVGYRKQAGDQRLEEWQEQLRKARTARRVGKVGRCAESVRKGSAR